MPEVTQLIEGKAGIQIYVQGTKALLLSKTVQQEPPELQEPGRLFPRELARDLLGAPNLCPVCESAENYFFKTKEEGGKPLIGSMTGK